MFTSAELLVTKIQKILLTTSKYYCVNVDKYLIFECLDCDVRSLVCLCICINVRACVSAFSRLYMCKYVYACVCKIYMLKRFSHPSVVCNNYYNMVRWDTNRVIQRVP